MNYNHWKWQPGKVDLGNRYFELKYGSVPAPIARIGIGESKTFIVEFLFNEIELEKRQEMFSEIIWEIELYLINNSDADPVEYMINHTKKCANMYSRIHWRYFPKGSKRAIILSKERTLVKSVTTIKNYFTKLLQEI
ncbi:MAG: hypothetical protein IT276_01125 [Ignavibacteriaceae bacterium]|nr:hypothetical protein [Ignavibacterium sp.]MCC6253495.1 hypothetical protein [Ignavibacteriaceae bacterium]HMN23508.1 hypothetical protein [Ignavibacteriaceae bacterium]HRN27186.1 hypothetical protein [Ignavibacteriaceae bacterium]HRP91518.1 hypothetical protein [Ignavibacteriaceae bacterium]